MDNQRLILLLVFFFSTMMLWNEWQRQGQPQPQPAATAQSITQVPGTAAGNAAVPPAPTSAGVKMEFFVKT